MEEVKRKKAQSNRLALKVTEVAPAQNSYKVPNRIAYRNAENMNSQDFNETQKKKTQQKYR